MTIMKKTQQNHKKKPKQKNPYQALKTNKQSPLP